MAHYEYLIHAEGSRLLKHGGIGGGRVGQRGVVVPDGLGHAAEADAATTLCGRTTSGLVAFAESVFENLNMEVRCSACSAAYDTLEL